MSEKDLKRLGQAVKDRRGELGLSQEEFCRRANLDGEPALSIKQLSRIEAGKVTPRAKTLGAIDRAAGWPAGTAARILSGGPSPMEDDLRDEVEREIMEITELDIATRWAYIRRRRRRAEEQQSETGR